MLALARRTVQNTLACVPHAGLFEAGADDRSTSGFDDAGAEEEVLAAEVRVAHAGCVALEVVGLGAKLVPPLGIGGRDGS